ncbi:MAG: Alpha/beta hydrolase [Frankiales bacterium]|nr:Alpha/beta hydrolase [Frankiales bacterium]
MTPVDAPPAWFTRALGQPPRQHDVAVEDRSVHVRTWGAPGPRPGVVLVHGGAAHSGWWDHVAPLLAVDRLVVAPDLSGHGDSSHTGHYSTQEWAQEVVAVAQDAGLEAPHVVGHSMGGWVAVTAGADHPDVVGSVVVLDSPLLEQPPEEQRLQHRRKPTRVYADRDEALSRFATIPAQDVVLPYVGRHVAEQSLRAVEGGWTWKFDPEMFGQRAPLRTLLPRLSCDRALFRCEHGLVSPDMADVMAGLLGEGAVVAELPDAGHHPMLDQPLALVAALRALLGTWEARRR